MAIPSNPSGDTRWNLMFRELKGEVSQPTENHPAARVWRESELKAVIMKIRKDQLAALKSTFPSAKDVIARMLEIGWLQIIPLESATGEDPPRMYLLDMEATEEDLPDAWELMQGFKSGGVLCYFGAVAFHELTTQEPSFYHIANLRSPGARVESTEIQPTGESSTSGRTHDPVGTLEFRFQGLPCYTTSRDTTTIPGIQTREYGPRTQLRITTFEQTMLDTLWQPLKCGGESVVFEAWERGVPRWNPDRMAKHLTAINRQDWDRRVGAMLSLMGVNVQSEALRSLLAARQEEMRNAPDSPPLHLMPGLPGARLLSEWGIMTP